MYLVVGRTSSGGLVGYDAAFTRLRSRVQFPLAVCYFYFSPNLRWQEFLHIVYCTYSLFFTATYGCSFPSKGSIPSLYALLENLILQRVCQHRLQFCSLLRLVAALQKLGVSLSRASCVMYPLCLHIHYLCEALWSPPKNKLAFGYIVHERPVVYHTHY